MLAIGGNSASTGYNLTRSLRFRASASAYLNRTPASATNRQTWTYSAWVKLSPVPQIGGYDSQLLTTKFDGVAPYATTIGINTNYKLVFASYDGSGGSPSLNLVTTQVFRDYSAWYHIVVVADTTQATAANRAKMYVNGVQITSFSTATYPSQNYNTYVNKNEVTVIGSLYYSGGGPYTYVHPFDGYTAETNLIDGQALTPSSFGSTNALTGVWQPARYTGTYGTNGFYLPFTDNSALTTSSNAGLGKDFSGNGNYWATNNISITAGVTYDSMTDVPTLTDASTANYAVLNPLDKSSNSTITNGNLYATASSAAWSGVRASMQLPITGQWYWEVNLVSMDTVNNGTLMGVAPSTSVLTNGPVANGGWFYQNNSGAGGIGRTVNPAGTITSYGAQGSTGNVIGIAYDASAGSLVFYRNGTSMGTAFASGVSGALFPIVQPYSTDIVSINFGQRPFAYTPPSGFVALNTFNLPTATILKGNTVMDATLYTGTGASLSVTNAASFKPDLVWVKGRSGATDHAWYDSVRGTTKQLESNNTGAETTEATGLTAFGSAGFTVGALAQMNTSAATYVGWQWQAGQGSSSSNTNGSITSTVSVNASAGFSVVTYTGTGANATVGHGLGVAPSMVITKSRSAISDWGVYHLFLTSASYYLRLNNNSGQALDNTYWNGTAPTSSVFSVGSAVAVNSNAATYAAYCWTPIAGYSAFGLWTNNNSTDGTFTYTGFRPKLIMLKETAAGERWFMYDSVRQTYNVTPPSSTNLVPSDASAEGANAATTATIDLLSNGFKIRTTNPASGEISFGTRSYIYAAFAENPLKYALAR